MKLIKYLILIPVILTFGCGKSELELEKERIQKEALELKAKIDSTSAKIDAGKKEVDSLMDKINRESKSIDSLKERIDKLK